VESVTAYFESANTKVRYEVVRFDGEKVVLRGPSGLEFAEKFKPDMFRQMGYTLKQGA
jgi:hypothetical protein